MTKPLNPVVLRQLAVTGIGASAGDHRRAFSPAHGRRSGFEAMAEQSASLPAGVERIFGLLLGASCLPRSIDKWSHRAIWVEEAMHRAASMLRLTLALRDSIDGATTIAPFGHALAAELAADLQSLSGDAEHAMVPCSRMLRDVVRNTTSLFGPAISGLEVTTDVDYVKLPAHKRRALVLLASELVVNALLHANTERSGGRLALTLQRVSENRARLRVKDDGIGRAGHDPDTSGSVAGGLAEVLDARLIYRGSRSWSTIAEVTFRARDRARAMALPRRLEAAASRCDAQPEAPGIQSRSRDGVE